MDDIIEIQHRIIETTGGTKGIRDIGLLNLSINSINQTFDGKELYPTVIEKAS